MHVHAPTEHDVASPQAYRAATRAIRVSLAVALAVMCVKLTATWLTGSRAILSDALESVIHIVATTVAAFSVWYANLPPDRSHPYGRERIVFFSAGMEGALISTAALSIVAVSIQDLIRGPEVRQLGLGLALTAAMAAVNLALGLYLLRTGRRTGSLAVEANGHHTLTDVWTSGAVVGGVAIVWLTDVVVLDPLVALLAGLHILWTGARLVRTSFRGLMGAVEPPVVARLQATLDRAVDDGLIDGFHALRCRAEGHTLWVELHLLVDGTLVVTDAHRLATSVETRISDAFPDLPVRVVTHVEPRAHRRAHPEGHLSAGDLATERRPAPEVGS